ncbi:MAG: hypothetical protein CMM60_13775 [Rhodospirillaceae bacterium]|jgi:hypothetical protein|nr:hypothetical protein [Rhodospirillaceae bacterium]|tara:strand:- start:3107 stop:4090 length:984 start_codon:yes stop_codon:yes gene_type:complete
MPKETLIAIGAGVLSAILATAFLSRVPGALVFVYLASLPLFVAGLALGPRAGMVSSAVGFMAVGLVGGGLSAGLFGLMQALPAWMIVRQMLLQRPAGVGPGPGSGPGAAIEWYPLGDMLCWLTMLAAAMLVLMAVAAAAGENGLSALVALNLNQILQSIAPEMDPESLEITVGIMAPLFPGAAGVSWLLMIIVNVSLAQGLLVKLGHNLRPSPSYGNLQLPQWMSWPLVGSAALALLGTGEMEYTGRNLAMILAVPYFFLGLTVVHAWAHRVSFTGTALVFFYLMLVIWGWAVLMVAGIGVIEQWTGLSRRMAGVDENGPPRSNDND